MFTTPKKATAFRPHPYHTPTRASPGGRMQPPPPSTPYAASPFANSPRPAIPSPRKFVLRGTPVRTPHRVEGNFRGHTQSPRKQPISPGRLSTLPIHLQPSPTLEVIIEESSHAIHNARVPLSKEDNIYWAELERLGIAHSFTNALAGAREAADRGAKDGPGLNAEVDARAQVRYPTKAEIKEQRVKEEAKRELARKRSFERRMERERQEEREHYLQKLADKKRRRAEREKLAQEAKLAANANHHSQPSSSTESSTTTLGPDSASNHKTLEASTPPPVSQQQQETEPVRQAAETEATMRAQVVNEAWAQFEAQQEQARLQALRAEQERKRVEEERFAAELERSQAAKTARRAAEEFARAAREHAIAEEERQRAERAARLAEEGRKQAERERLRAQQEEETRLRAIEEAERAFAQWKANEEARMRDEYSNLEQRQAELRRMMEQADMSYLHQMTLQAELERLQTEILVREEQINSTKRRNRLADYYHYQAAQRAQEEEYLRQQQYQQQQQQEHHQQQHSYNQESNFNSYQDTAEQNDIPMRDSSFMQASMHPEETPYTSYNNSSDTSYATPPPPPPPVPPTPVELYAIWKAKWKEMDSRTDLSSVHFSELPWPVSCPVNSVDDITIATVLEFINHPDRPSGLSFKRLLAYYHSDRFEHRVKRKMHPDQQAIVDDIAKQCTITLVKLLH